MIPWYLILVAAAVGVAIIVIQILTFKKFAELLKNKFDKNKSNKKTFFGKTEKMTAANSDDEMKVKSDELKKEEQAGKMSANDWDDFVKESNYVSVEYDIEKDEIINVGRYKVESVDAEMQKCLKDNDDILIVSA